MVEREIHVIEKIEYSARARPLEKGGGEFGRGPGAGGGHNGIRLLTSRLSTVEASRAINRLRHLGQVGETQLADVEREIESLWSRCEVWELTPAICESARRIAPNKLLRALDALHLATFILARQRIADLEMLTVDQRLQAAVGENRKGGG